MTSRFEVRIAGRLPHVSAELIGSRFGQVDLCEWPDSTVLIGTIPDQAALRSLLTLIWDTGGSILSVTLDADAGEDDTSPAAHQPRLVRGDRDAGLTR